MANPTLTESIEKAMEDQDNEKTNEKSDEKVPERAEDGKEHKKSDVSDDDKSTKTGTEEKSTEYIPDPEIENAIKLYSALNDPEQQIPLIKELALRAGLIKSENEKLTKDETKSILDTLNEALGEEYGDLKDKLTPVFKNLETKHANEITKLRNELKDKELNEARNQFSAEFDSFITENKITEKEAELMLVEIEQMPPNPNAKNKITLKSYLTKIHRLIDNNKTETKHAIERVKKIENNRSERVSNLSSDVSDTRIKAGSKNPTIREAIEAAQRGEKFDE